MQIYRVALFFFPRSRYVWGAVVQHMLIWNSAFKLRYTFPRAYKSRRDACCNLTFIKKHSFVLFPQERGVEVPRALTSGSSAFIPAKEVCLLRILSLACFSHKLSTLALKVQCIQFCSIYQCGCSLPSSGTAVTVPPERQTVAVLER